MAEETIRLFDDFRCIMRARILLANNLACSGQDADQSIRHLQTAVALRPGDPNTLYNAAMHLRHPWEKNRGP
jgi:hypothetical protein